MCHYTDTIIGHEKCASITSSDFQVIMFFKKMPFGDETPGQCLYGISSIAWSFEYLGDAVNAVANISLAKCHM